MLQSYFNKKLISGKSLIIFDEVQLLPKKDREMIKRLVADRRFHYIETGSLMSIKKNIKDILIPYEEREIKMHPMVTMRRKLSKFYRKLLFNKLEFNNGMVIENLTGQMLNAAGRPLFYYYSTEDGKTEVDFLIVKDGITSRHNILPIEVKSGRASRIASLNKYRQKFSQQVGIAYVFYDGEIKEEDGVTYLAAIYGWIIVIFSLILY